MYFLAERTVLSGAIMDDGINLKCHKVKNKIHHKTYGLCSSLKNELIFPKHWDTITYPKI